MEDKEPLFRIDAERQENFRKDLNGSMAKALRERFRDDSSVLKERHWKRALAHEAEWGGFLPSIMVELGFLSSDTILMELSRAWKTPLMPLTENTVDFQRAKKIGEKFCRENWVCPILTGAVFPDDGGPHSDFAPLAMAMPLDLVLLDDFYTRTGLSPIPFLALPFDIEYWLRSAFPALNSREVTEAYGELTKQEALDMACDAYENGRLEEARILLEPLVSMGDTVAAGFLKLVDSDSADFGI